MSAQQDLSAAGAVNSLDSEAFERRGRWTTFLVSSAIVLAAALLQITDKGELALTGDAARPLPSLCLTRSLAHMDCPGCGMTRSFVAMAHGELLQAFACHRLGPLLFLLVAAQVPLGAYALLRRKCGNHHLRSADGQPSASRGRTIGLLIVLALLANWAYNVATGAAFH